MNDRDKVMRLDRAYDEGYACRQSGGRIEDNPYEDDSTEFETWLDGYEDAAEDDVDDDD
jgi:ribosome modulation factor